MIKQAKHIDAKNNWASAHVADCPLELLAKHLANVKLYLATSTSTYWHTTVMARELQFGIDWIHEVLSKSGLHQDPDDYLWRREGAGRAVSPAPRVKRKRGKQIIVVSDEERERRRQVQERVAKMRGIPAEQISEMRARMGGG